jgi:hypothetical protein
MNFSSVSPLAPAPSLETYTEAAKDGHNLYVHIDGNERRVLSWGKSPTGRSVAWLEPDVDTTSMFTQALAQAYGQGIASAVSRQLGLEPSPGEPISARIVMSAVDMADTAKDAMAGVDFLSLLSTSAVSNTPVFRQACKDCRLNPDAITAQQRTALDDAMKARFQAAAHEGTSPVSLQTAAQWLRELLVSGVGQS